MKLRHRLDALERAIPLPADLVVCSSSEEASRRNLPLEAVVIVTGVPRHSKET